MQSSSEPKGSTARNLVLRVVSSRFLPQGMDAENPNGPAGMGQYVVAGFCRVGSGEGGRNGSQKNELSMKALSVSMFVDVNSVAVHRSFRVTKRQVGETSQMRLTEAGTLIRRAENFLCASTKHREIQRGLVLVRVEQLGVYGRNIEFRGRIARETIAKLEGGGLSIDEETRRETEKKTGSEHWTDSPVWSTVLWSSVGTVIRTRTCVQTRRMVVCLRQTRYKLRARSSCTERAVVYQGPLLFFFTS